MSDCQLVDKENEKDVFPFGSTSHFLWWQQKKILTIVGNMLQSIVLVGRRDEKGFAYHGSKYKYQLLKLKVITVFSRYHSIKRYVNDSHSQLFPLRRDS